MSGSSRMALMMSAFTFLMSVSGVPGGASKACQPTDSETGQRFSHGRQIRQGRHAASRRYGKRHHIAGVDRAGNAGISLENEVDAFAHHVVDDRRSAAGIR